MVIGASFLDAFRIRRGDVVSIVGSGGKVTLMYHLAHEARDLGYSVLTTSSTHLHPPTSRESDGLLITSEEPDWSHTLRERFPSRRHMTVVGSRPRPDKLRGLDLKTLERLRAVCPSDLMMIKADGARTRPFKAPGDHEPVVPSWTTHCVIVVGLQCLGLPLNDRHVHRPERVAALSGLRHGDALTSEAVAKVVGHPEAYVRAFPPEAKRVLYLGWCSDTDRRKAAADICRAVDPQSLPLVFCGAIEKEGATIERLR